MCAEATMCYTLDAALEQALEMENETFLTLLAAIRRAINHGAKAILRDTAHEKLRLKFLLEEAILDGSLTTDDLQAAAPTMDFGTLFGVKQLADHADSREALAFCIHLVQGSVSYYRELGDVCAGAPMGPIFKRLGDDQSALLRKLEDDYEIHCLPEG